MQFMSRDLLELYKIHSLHCCFCTLGSIALFIIATMPRLSKRQLLLREYERFLDKRLKERLLRHAVGLEDDTQDQIDAIVEDKYKELLSKRYLFRGAYRKADHAAFLSIMSYVQAGSDDDSDKSSIDSDSSNIPWLNETEFLNEFRMSPMDFWKLVDLIKDDRIFKRKRAGRSQAPVELQLAVNGTLTMTSVTLTMRRVHHLLPTMS
jgi:hypothetical protein